MGFARTTIVAEELGRQAGRSVVAPQMTLVRSLVGLTILLKVLLSRDDLLFHDNVIVRLACFADRDLNARIVLLGHFWSKSMAFRLSWLIFEMINRVEFILDLRRFILLLEFWRID